MPREEIKGVCSRACNKRAASISIEGAFRIRTDTGRNGNDTEYWNRAMVLARGEAGRENESEHKTAHQKIHSAPQTAAIARGTE